jgi:hypothetical protein
VFYLSSVRNQALPCRGDVDRLCSLCSPAQQQGLDQDGGLSRFVAQPNEPALERRTTGAVDVLEDFYYKSTVTYRLHLCDYLIDDVYAVSEGIHPRGALHPAFRASSSVQNQRSPRLVLIPVRSYASLPGTW